MKWNGSKFNKSNKQLRQKGVLFINSIPEILCIFAAGLPIGYVFIHQMNHKRYYERTNRLVTRYTNVGGWYDIKNRPTRWEFVWNKLYRRDFLNEHDIRFREDLSYGEDELFNLECLAADNRIHHAGIEVTAVIHHFENKQSLSRIKTAEDLIDHIRAIEDFLLASEDPTISSAVCEIIADHWRSKSFMKLLGLQE